MGRAGLRPGRVYRAEGLGFMRCWVAVSRTSTRISQVSGQLSATAELCPRALVLRREPPHTSNPNHASLVPPKACTLTRTNERYRWPAPQLAALSLNTESHPSPCESTFAGLHGLGCSGYSGKCNQEALLQSP